MLFAFSPTATWSLTPALGYPMPLPSTWYSAPMLAPSALVGPIPWMSCRLSWLIYTGGCVDGLDADTPMLLVRFRWLVSGRRGC